MAATPTAARPARSAPLDVVLQRGVDARIVTSEQAAQLAALAATPPTPPRGDAGPSPVWIEVLGYLGGALALAAGSFVAQELWADLDPWARAAILGVLAIATAAAGALLRSASNAVGRLASFLWLLSVPAVGGAVAVLVDDLSDADGITVALSSVAVATVVAWVLWALRPAVLQHAVAFVGLAVVGGTALVQVDESLAEHVGYYVWALGAAWLLLAGGRVMRPVGTAWVVGAIAFVMGPLFVGEGDPTWMAAVLGLGSAAALVAVAVRRRRIAVIAIGVLGLLQHVPRLLFAFFEGQVAAPVVVLISGIVLLGASVVLARRLVVTDREQERRGELR